MPATRVGLVGAGAVAQRHARVLAGLPDVQLAGVTDVVPQAARRLAADYGVSARPDVAALLADGVDAMYVCVPPFAHGPAERAVIDAGVPLFVEKPIEIKLDKARATAALIAERGLLTAVGHQWRYSALVERARDGAPPAIDGADIDSATAATLHFAGGAVGTLAATCVLGWKQRAGLEIYADGLALAITEDHMTVRDGDGEWSMQTEPDAARVAIDRAFIDAVRGAGDDVRVPYAEALRTHALATAVAESAATGHSVTVPHD
jgi:myo-inositol 2-dehydrogenase/D-chiro-inositol 1-dehydrogenase